MGPLSIEFTLHNAVLMNSRGQSCLKLGVMRTSMCTRNSISPWPCSSLMSRSQPTRCAWSPRRWSRASPPAVWPANSPSLTREGKAEDATFEHKGFTIIGGSKPAPAR